MATARGALRERLQAKLSVIRLGLPPLRPDRIFALIGADPSSSGPCLVPSIHPSAWNMNSTKFACTELSDGPVQIETRYRSSDLWKRT